MKSALLQPMLALMGLSLSVLILAARRRVAEIRRRRIPLHTLARAQDTAQAFEDTAAMDNFNNLMQMPVLFYALCLTLSLLEGAGPLSLTLAWLYVALRGIHSAIQLGSNRVLRRFQVWMASNGVLLLLWLAALYSLL